MNESKDTTFAGQMASLLPNSWLLQQAKEQGVVKRQRLLHIQDLIWTLILAFGTGHDVTLTDLRASLNLRTGQDLAASSFNQRFTPQLASMMFLCVQHLLEQARQARPAQQSKWLQYFSNMTAIDSTVIKVHHSLRHLWPSCKNAQAALKIHAAHNLAHGLPCDFKMTAGTVHDIKPYKTVGAWVKGHLMLVDLGYYCFNLLERLDRQQAFFVTRAKSNFNPVIKAVHGKCKGRPIDLEGKKLDEVMGRLKRQVVDVMVEVQVPKRKYKGKRRFKTFQMRLVLVRNDETSKYHSYLTNLPVHVSGQEVASLYKMRWEIELLFKALKSGGGGLVSIPGKREAVVKTLVWASLAKLLLSRLMLRRVRRGQRHKPGRFPEGRWEKRFAQLAGPLMNHLIPLRVPLPPDPIMHFLLTEALDPNKHRAKPLYSLAIC